MISEIIWTLFAWIFGLLFFIGGIYSLFKPVYSNNNFMVSILSICLGLFIVYRWFKQRKPGKSTIKHPQSTLFKVGIGFLIFDSLILLMMEDKIFVNLSILLQEPTLETFGLLLAENCGKNLLTLIPFGIGLHEYKKKNNLSGKYLMLACIAIFILSFLIL